MTDPEQLVTKPELRARLEALLFVAPGAVTSAQLAAVLEITQREVDEALQGMQQDYQVGGRGVALQFHNGRVQMTSAPGMAVDIERFLGLESTARLSRAGLEALTIVAYRQPITRPAVDAVRGVNSDGVLKSLLSRGLIQEVGRAEGPGRPILYGTTAEFLQHFGLPSLEVLPPYEIAPEDREDQNNGLLKD